MDSSYLARIEMGVRNPTWHKLGALSKALGFPMSRLADEAETVARDSYDAER
jgi:transcriptional regulator with XRE-family HTH domain